MGFSARTAAPGRMSGSGAGWRWGTSALPAGGRVAAGSDPNRWFQGYRGTRFAESNFRCARDDGGAGAALNAGPSASLGMTGCWGCGRREMRGPGGPRYSRPGGRRYTQQKNGPRFWRGPSCLGSLCYERFFGGHRRGSRKRGKCLGGVAAALGPLRTCRRPGTLGWGRALGRQTVFHQPDMHAAFPHPRRLGIFIACGCG